MNEQSASVRRYYEANTRWMLAWGSGRGEGVIHRPVWLPGTTSRAQAARSVDALILARVAAEVPQAGSGRKPARLLDLGCGSGATAVWLARRLPAEVTGITLSPRQVQLARRLAERRGVAERCRFLEGDFLQEGFPAEDRSPSGTPGAGAADTGFDALYAIESFSHAADPDAFCAQAARRLCPGGRLFVCDDFRADVRRADDPPPDGLPMARDSGARRVHSRNRWLEAFRQGWQLGPLCAEEELAGVAGRWKLDPEERIDLSPYLRNRSARAKWTYRLLRLWPGNDPRLSSLRGGAALQVCLHEGWVRYLFLVFQKRS